MFDKLFDVLLKFVGLFHFWTIIYDYEKGVILRLGKFHRYAKPGLNLRIPFSIEECMAINAVFDTMDLGQQSLTTKDGHNVVLSTYVSWTVKDPRKALLTVDGVESVLSDVASGYIEERVAAATWDEVRTATFRKSLKKHIQRQARKWGISVKNVQFSDRTRSRSLRLWMTNDGE